MTPHGVPYKQAIVGSVNTRFGCDDYLGTFAEEDMANEQLVGLVEMVKEGGRTKSYEFLRSRVISTDKGTEGNRPTNVPPIKIEEALGIDWDAGNKEVVSFWLTGSVLWTMEWRRRELWIQGISGQVSRRISEVAIRLTPGV